MPSKRQAVVQITKDDYEQHDGSDAEDVPVTHNIQRASGNVLSKRRIVRVSRDAEGNVIQKTKNPFQNVSLTSQPAAASALEADDPVTKKAEENAKESVAAAKATSIFGSGSTFTAGFGAAKKQKHDDGYANKPTKLVFGSSTTFGGFGSASSSISGFQGFGSLGKSIGFGKIKSDDDKPFGGGLAQSSASAFSTNNVTTSYNDINEEAAPADATPAVTLPTDVELKSGEEDEECKLQLRAKLFRWAKMENTKSDDAATGATVTAQSVPPSASMTKSVSRDEGDDTTAEKTDEGEKNATADTNKKPSSDNALKSEFGWKEVGIGPIRVLQQRGKDLFRLVMRQEVQPGGVGIRVILNVRWDKVESMSDKTLRIVSVDKKIFSLKFKLAMEASEFRELLESLTTSKSMEKEDDK